MANLCSHRKCWKAWLKVNLEELHALYFQNCFRVWNRNRGEVDWHDSLENSKVIYVDRNSKERAQRLYTTYSLGCLGAEEDQVFVRRYGMAELPYTDPLSTGYQCIHEEGYDAYEITSGEEEYLDLEDAEASESDAEASESSDQDMEQEQEP